MEYWQTSLYLLGFILHIFTNKILLFLRFLLIHFILTSDLQLLPLCMPTLIVSIIVGKLLLPSLKTDFHIENDFSFGRRKKSHKNATHFLGHNGTHTHLTATTKRRIYINVINNTYVMPKIEFSADLDLSLPIDWIRFECDLLLRRCQRKPLILLKSMVDNPSVHSNQILNIGNQLISVEPPTESLTQTLVLRNYPRMSTNSIQK